jgi:hypothetical protein
VEPSRTVVRSRFDSRWALLDRCEQGWKPDGSKAIHSQFAALQQALDGHFAWALVDGHSPRRLPFDGHTPLREGHLKMVSFLLLLLLVSVDSSSSSSASIGPRKPSHEDIRRQGICHPHGINRKKAKDDRQGRE